MPARQDPHHELIGLIRALRRTARRRGALGLHSTPVPQEPPSAPRAEKVATSGPPAQSRPAQSRPAPSRPAQSPEQSRPAQSPAASRPAEPAPAAMSPADDVRARAAACPNLSALRAAVADCTACPLARTRTQTVFSDGDSTCRALFVGEAPGFHEDRQGIPFVGPAGELLTSIVEKGMGLRRDEVGIVNVLKCRPPDNRDPLPEEKRICTEWLDLQIELMDPEVVIALGRHAAGHLLSRDDTMGRMRGKVFERNGRKVVATYHPAFLLRSPHMKKDCWQDIQLAMGLLGLKPRGKQ
ncbi:MAG: uracil-DNA glycosylase [bacterium]|nr:uracil-DNA glycosylase [bacterium]